MSCRIRRCSRNRRSYPHLQFFRFPENPSIRAAWASFARIGNDVIKPSTRICSVHFCANDFELDENGNRMKKKKGAIPSIDAFLKSDSEDDELNAGHSEQKSLPLYSSKALNDHNYADFISRAQEPPEESDYESDTEENVHDAGPILSSQVPCTLPQEKSKAKPLCFSSRCSW